MSRRAESPPATPQAGAPTLRTFIAIPLADPARAAVAAYLERLRATIGGVAWTRTDNLHLTLRFLGNVAVERIPALVQHLDAALTTQPAFAMPVVGVGAFPSVARPRTLWVGVTAAQLAPLAAAVETACVAAGFEPEGRPLRPHTTLGRVRATSTCAPDLGMLAADGRRDFGVAPAVCVVLFRSELGSGGTRHTPLASFPLSNAAQFS